MAWRDPGHFKLRARAGLTALQRPRISKDGTHDEHPPARDEMRQVVRQALDVFARLLLEALHFDDLGDQTALGLNTCELAIGGDRCRFEDRLSHKPRTLEKSPTDAVLP